MAIPRVSVVLTAHNLRYMRVAIESILNQTFTDFEFIIVDDGAVQAASTLLADYAARDTRIVLSRNERNWGQAPSLNKGLARARGEYIARQDDDDLSLPTRLVEQVAFLDAHPQVGLLGTQVDIINADGEVIDGSGFFHPEVKSATIREGLFNDCCLCHGSVMIRRECLLAAGSYDVNMAPAEDYDLWLRLADLTDLARLEARLYQFRYHPESISQRQNHLQLLRKAETLEKALQRRFGLQPPRDKALPLARHYRRAAISNYLNGELGVTQKCLARALYYGPQLFDSRDVYVPIPPTEVGFAFAESVFAEVPSTGLHGRVKERLRSQLHMRQVFEAVGAGDAARIDAHLWPGIRCDPAWLVNRGVISILAKSVVRRVRSRLKTTICRSSRLRSHR